MNHIFKLFVVVLLVCCCSEIARAAEKDLKFSLEFQTASTNRTKVGYRPCALCGDITNVYSTMTIVESGTYSGTNGAAFTNMSHAMSYTYPYSGGGTSGGFYSVNIGSGTNSSSGYPCFATVTNGVASTNCYYDFPHDEGGWTFDPPVQDGCSYSDSGWIEEGYYDIYNTHITQSGEWSSSTIYSDEVTTASLLDLSGVSFSDWAPGSGGAFVTVSLDEMTGAARKMKWRVKYLAAIGEVVEFTVVETYKGDCTNEVKTTPVRRMGTGQVEYYPSSSGTTVEAPIRTPDPDCSECGTVASGRVEISLGGDCNSCKTGKCGAGTGTGKNESVSYTAGLGFGGHGEERGSLVLYSTKPDASLASPAKLEYFGTLKDIELVKSNGVLRHARAPQCLADIVPINGDKFEIRFYLTPGSKDGNGFYSSPSGLFSTHIIQHVSGSTNHLKITDGTAQHDYTWSASDQGWTLDSGNGVSSLRKTTVSHDDVALIKTNIIRNPDNSIVYKEVSHYLDLPSYGPVLLQSVVDPSGAALTSQYQYYTNSTTDGTNYGKVRLQIDPTGFWMKWEYDTNGYLLKETRQFLNAATNAIDSACRVIDYQRDFLTNALESIKTVETLLGVEVSRSYHLEFYGEHWDVQCQTPGALWYAGDNLTTISRFYTNGAFALELKSVSHPNGTVDLYEYETNAIHKVTTVYSGEPNSGGTAVVDGTKTVTTTDPVGNPISITKRDIASDIIIESEVYGDPDSFGRPQETTHLEGLQTHRTYDACCGLVSTVDKTFTTTTYGYDALKRLLMTTRHGITNASVYDAAANIVSSTRTGTNGNTIILNSTRYDLALRPTHLTNALLHVTTNRYGYNGSGETVVTNLYADGGVQIETSAKDGTLLSVKGSAVHPVRYEYGVEPAGTNALGLNVTNVFTKEIKLDAGGNDTAEWKKEYVDLLGRTWKTVYANDGVEYSFYDNAGQLRKTVDPDGVTKLFSYNARGEVEFESVDLDQDGSISTSVDRVTRMVRDVTTKEGHDVLRTRTYAYPTNGSASQLLVSTVELAANGLRQWSESFGVSNRMLTTYSYSDKSVFNYAPDNSYTKSDYLNGRLTAVTRFDSNDLQLQKTSYGYDEHGRRATVEDYRNGITTYTYNNGDLVATVTTPEPETLLPAQTTTYQYDGVGRVTNTIYADATELKSEYFPSGELKKSHGSRAYPVGYTYDAQGRMKTMTTWQDYPSGGAAVTTWNYDSESGFLLSKLYANSQGTTYGNSLGGRLLSRTWARGVTTTYGYSEAGDLDSMTYSDSTPAVTTIYDRRGRKKTVVQGTITNEFNYHDSGRLLSETSIGGPLDGITVTNTYDTLLRRTNLMAKFTSTPLIQHSYGYGEASRLDTVSDGTNSATYAYLADSPLVESITFKQSSTERMKTEKVYDYLNRLKSITHSTNSVALAEYVYTSNDANQRVRVNEADGSYWAYEYDELGQVKSGKKYWNDNTPVAGQQFEYVHDDIGNRKTTGAGGDEFGANLRNANYSVNNLNQYTSRMVPAAVDIIGTANTNSTVTVNNQATYRKGEYYHAELSITNSGSPVYPSVTNLAVLNDGSNPDIVTNHTGNVFIPQSPETFSYDLDGNLTNDGRWIYTWDAENRLIQMEANSNVPNGAKLKLAFTYDSNWRRIQKVVSNYNGSAYVALSTNRFVYDGWNMVAQLNGTPALQQSFMWGTDLSGTMQGAGGVGGLMALTDHLQFGTHFYGYDGNGNVTTLVNADDGIVSGNYDYNAFGETLCIIGADTAVNPFRFSTKYIDQESGAFYYGFRYYNPAIGKWLSRDPMEEGGGLALTVIVNNDSIAKFDKLGLYIYNEDIQRVDPKHKDLDGSAAAVFFTANISKLKTKPLGKRCFIVEFEITGNAKILFGEDMYERTASKTGLYQYHFDHEIHHASLYSWGMIDFEESINGMIVCCKSSCLGQYESLIRAKFDLAFASAAKENVDFDLQEYADPKDPKVAEKIAKRKKAIEDAEKNVAAANIAYEQCK